MIFFRKHILTAGLFYDKNFPSRNNDLSQKNKGVLYSGIDKKTLRDVVV